MDTNEAPAALAAEGTATPAPDVLAPDAAAPDAPAHDPQPGESPSAYNRRLIEATKRERRAVEAERSAARARTEVEQYRAEVEQARAERASWAQARESAVRDPRAYLNAAGLDLDTVVRSFLDEGPTPDVAMADMTRKQQAEAESLRREIQAIRDELAKEREQSQQVEASKAIASIQHEISTHLRGNPDQYEFTLMQEQEGEVFELMKLAYQQHNTVLSVSQAADMIEEHLLNQVQKLAKAKKFASLSRPQESIAAPQSAGRPTTQAKYASDARAPASVTLTSKLATPPAQPEQSEELLDRDVALDLITKKIKATREQKRAAR